MFFKQIFVFVAVLLCAQLSLCNVIKTKESEDQTHKNVLALLKRKLNAQDRSDTSFENSLDERAKLMRLLLNEIFVMAEFSTTSAKTIFKDVIADVGNLNNSDGTSYSHLVEIKDLVNQIEAKHDENVFGNIIVFNKLAKIIIKFDEENKETKISTTQDEQFSESLKKNGFEAFVTEFKNRTIAFVEKMYNAALHYWSTLSDDEKVEEKRFGEWLTLMKDEQDTEKRCELFTNIFSLL